MDKKMFSPGDIVRMKPIEEVIQIVQKYWPNNYKNKDYITGLLKYSNKTVTVANICNIHFNDNLRTYYIVPETYDNGWTLLQDYFELCSIKINNNIPDLFGI